MRRLLLALGSVILIVGVAYAGAPYFTWTRSEGIVKIGGGGYAGHPAISGDGSSTRSAPRTASSAEKTRPCKG